MQDFSICKLHILLDSTNNMEIWDSLFRSGNQLVLRILDILYACLPSRSLKCVPRQSNSSQRRRSWMEVHSEWWTHSLFESVTSLFAWEQAKSVSYLAWESQLNAFLVKIPSVCLPFSHTFSDDPQKKIQSPSASLVFTSRNLL